MKAAFTLSGNRDRSRTYVHRGDKIVARLCKNGDAQAIDWLWNNCYRVEFWETAMHNWRAIFHIPSRCWVFGPRLGNGWDKLNSFQQWFWRIIWSAVALQGAALGREFVSRCICCGKVQRILWFWVNTQKHKDCIPF